MQIIKQIALCVLCVFAFGACDSNDSSVDSANSRDSSQNQSNATILQQSQSDKSTNALDSSPISLDEVYVNIGEKPLQIISDKIDFWGKGFFLEWCEGCGEYITNGEGGGVIGIRIFDKSRGEMISDGAINDTARNTDISHQKVLSAEFENGIWTLAR